MRADQGVLVTYENDNWLVTDTGRHAIDLVRPRSDLGGGHPVTAKATPISEGLFNALPNAGPWRLPADPRFGEPNTVGLPPNLVIGAVFKALTEDGEQHFVVLPDGVAQVNGTTAAALRATNSFGLDHAAVGRGQHGREDHRAGVRLAAAGRAVGDPAA